MSAFVEEVGFYLPAADVFPLFSGRRYSFFLDSGMELGGYGRYSFIGSGPFLAVKSRGDRTELVSHAGREVRRGNPFDVLDGLLEKYSAPRQSLPFPFPGGAVGYFSYDLCHFIEKLPKTAVDDIRAPEMYFAFYDTIIAFDQVLKKMWIVSNVFPGLGGAAGQKARLDGIRSTLAGAAARRPERVPVTAAVPGAGLKCNFNRPDYLKAVARAREYIIAGDIFQVNLSQRFEVELPLPAAELYTKLRRINPAPFAAYLNFPGVSVVSSSPERFLELRGGIVQTRPIKGTRPRGKTPEEDEALGRELTASIKDRAENTMIVDLERNDIGRVCRFGSVKVTDLLALEKFPTVFHLTSTVQGALAKGKTRGDLLKACFPGGSITGAPKVRSMEIIDELEPTRRSVYTGSIGYLGFDGDMDLNIAIRTFIIKGRKAYFQVGGGIVYDSDPESEYDETIDKARALFYALGIKPEAEAAKWS